MSRSVWSKAVTEIWAVETPAWGGLGATIRLYETLPDAERAASLGRGMIRRAEVEITSFTGEEPRFAERAEIPTGGRLT